MPALAFRQKQPEGCIGTWAFGSEMNPNNVDLDSMIMQERNQGCVESCDFEPKSSLLGAGVPTLGMKTPEGRNRRTGVHRLTYEEAIGSPASWPIPPQSLIKPRRRNRWLTLIAAFKLAQALLFIAASAWVRSGLCTRTVGDMLPAMCAPHALQSGIALRRLRPRHRFDGQRRCCAGSAVGFTMPHWVWLRGSGSTWKRPGPNI